MLTSIPSAMMALESIEDMTAEEEFSAAELDRIAEQFDPPSQALTEMVEGIENLEDAFVKLVGTAEGMMA